MLFLPGELAEKLAYIRPVASIFGTLLFKFMHMCHMRQLNSCKIDVDTLQGQCNLYDPNYIDKRIQHTVKLYAPQSSPICLKDHFFSVGIRWRTAVHDSNQGGTVLVGYSCAPGPWPNIQVISW